MSDESSASEVSSIELEEEDEEEIFSEDEYHEPEYSTSPSSTESDSEVESDWDLNSGRLENLHWCRCLECVMMPTLVESKCCNEFRNLIEDKLPAGGQQCGVCITQNPHFADICLKKHILETAYIQHRRYRNRFTDVSSMDNR